MTAMQNFCFWFLDKLPDFLMSEPIIYLVGFFFLGLTIKLFTRILNINN